MYLTIKGSRPQALTLDEVYDLCKRAYRAEVPGTAKAMADNNRSLTALAFGGEEVSVREADDSDSADALADGRLVSDVRP